MPLRSILDQYGLNFSDSSRWMYWLVGAVLVVLIPKLFNSYRRSRALPPGPRGLPILGNVLQAPTQMPWFKFAEWGQQYGPIFSLNMAGQTVIVLSTFKAAGDLLDRRSNLYSDRPRLIMASEILTGESSWCSLVTVLHGGKCAAHLMKLSTSEQQRNINQHKSEKPLLQPYDC
ncbi:hypothetical protein CPB84DRAFT_654879 [Gymnopilus junonius]|uniref:Cytochrome P450 n=1 Tax=Gymnopilus junonius TaxID=109634 RepID=A0A9P5TR01_GYMJU|nr:hypothetical protein CPB84DRAFT_654879 [Gymnopilus junonius]